MLPNADPPQRPLKIHTHTHQPPPSHNQSTTRQGTPFFFDGSDNANFALISEADHQINAKFGSLGPSHGVDSTIWMIGE